MTLLEQLATFLALKLADPEDDEPLRGVRSEASIARSRAEQMVIIHTLQCSLNSHYSRLNCPHWRLH